MNKQRRNIKEGQKLNLRISGFIFFSFFIIWIYLVLIKTNYFNSMPLPFTPTGIFEGFDIKLDFKKILFLLKSFFISVFILFSCLGYGSVLLKKIINDKEESFVLSFVFGCGVLALLTFFVGIIGFLFKEVLIFILLIGTILGILNIKTFLDADILKPKFKFFQLVFFLVFLYTALINLLGCLTPETFFDSQFYLLGVLNQWRHEHKMFFNQYINASLFPFNINMLYLVALVLNNDISAKIIHWFCGILCCWTVYVFVKKYFSKTTALVAVLIFYTVPTLMAVSWKTAIELGIAMFETAAVFCMIEYIAKNEKKYLILSGIFWGFALGSKYLVLLEFFSISLAFVLFNFFYKKNFSSVLKEYLLFLAIALIFCSPWYLRNLVLTGNSVFPFFAHKIGFIKPRVVGSIFADPPNPKFSFKNYFLFLWPLSLGQLQQESYPGGIFLVFLPFLFLFKNVDKKIKFLCLYVFLCLILWITIGRFYLRYFIPVLPFVGLIYSYFISENNLSKNFKFFLNLLFLFILCSNINFAKRILHFTQTPAHFVFTDITVKEYLSTQRPSYPYPYYQVADYINKNLPKYSKILLLGETRGLFFERKYLTQGVLEYSPLIELLKNTTSADEFHKKLLQQGITHILLNVPEAKRLAGYDNFYFEPNEFKVWCEFWNKYVKEIYKDIADISFPDRRIFSMKKQQPQWWQWYSSDPNNYVYLYEVISKEEANKPHTPPLNFFLQKELYVQHRWEKLEKVVEEIKKLYQTVDN